MQSWQPAGRRWVHSPGPNHITEPRAVLQPRPELRRRDRVLVGVTLGPGTEEPSLKLCPLPELNGTFQQRPSGIG